jgi:hypothetical protein
MRWTPLIVLALIAAPAAARVYEWRDPDSGNVYMSGSPPAWYRAGTSGPRVLVFDAGRLVDDTGQAASEEEARQLREAALEEARRRQEEASAAAEAPADQAGEEPAAPPVDAGTEARVQAEAAFAGYLKSLVADYFKAAGVPAGTPSAPPGAPTAAPGAGGP